jgi:hypothetical protein
MEAAVEEDTSVAVAGVTVVAGEVPVLLLQAVVLLLYIQQE